ncbi:MAG: hypothetical protein JEY94_04365 [Melioribacteraceae bacterium]|nr:hypothetical protein [Melioribacteraceae bacterium]
MLKLLISELKYNLTIYLLYLVMTPMFYTAVLLYNNDFLLGMIESFFPFMLINQIIIRRNKEFREKMFNTIPINRELLGIHRLLIVLIPITICFLILIPIAITLSDGFHELEKLSIIYGLIIICLSLYFIIRDVFLSHLREKGITKSKMLIYLMLTGLVLNITGVVLFMLVKAGYEIPIKPLFQFLENHSPFSGELIGLRTVALGFMLTVLSVYSYNRNRSHIE